MRQLVYVVVIVIVVLSLVRVERAVSVRPDVREWPPAAAECGNIANIALRLVRLVRFIRLVEEEVGCELFVLIAGEVGLDDHVSLKSESTELETKVSVKFYP